MSSLRILGITCYYAKNYPRGRAIIEALKTCSDVSEVTNEKPGLGRYAEVFLKLSNKVRHSRFDFLLFTFRFADFWLISLPLHFRQKSILDAMIPIAVILRQERKKSRFRFLWPLIMAFERSMLKTGTLIITDTSRHQRIFRRFYNIPDKRMLQIPLSTDENFFCFSEPRPISKDKPLKILYYGSDLPLHGFDLIFGVSEQLLDENIELDVYGVRDSERYKHLANSAVRAFPRCKHTELPGLISSADICLGGPFGATGQARRVVTNKTYQFISVGRPVIIGDSLVVKEAGFINKKNCILVSLGDPASFVNAIKWASENRHLLPELGRRARELYEKKFSAMVNGEIIKAKLQSLNC